MKRYREMKNIKAIIFDVDGVIFRAYDATGNFYGASQ